MALSVAVDRPRIDTMLEGLGDSVWGTLFSDEFCPGDYSRGDTTHSDTETLAHASRLNYYYGARPVTRAARRGGANGWAGYCASWRCK